MDGRTTQTTIPKDKAMQTWQDSTGDITIEGKAVASRNAFKGGFRQELKTLIQLLRNQQISINEL